MAEEKMSDDELFDLRQEILMAKKLNEEFLLPQMQEAIQRYTGEFIPLIGQNWDIALNEIYPVIQFNLPSTYFRNPRAFLKPRNKNYVYKRRNPTTGQMEQVFGDSSKSAKTQEGILNYILGEIRYKRYTQQVLMDALLFKFGCLWHGYKGEFGMTDEQSLFIEKEQVFVGRISPLRFLKDPTVGISNLENARWIGRSFDVPLVDLLEDDTLKVDKSLKGKHGYGNRIRVGESSIPINGVSTLRPETKSLIDLVDGRFKDSPRSRFVEVFEIFIRPSPKERREGSRGKVVLLTFEQTKPLRPVSPWPYKAEGWPAKILEFNYVPESQFGLADIDTYKAVADQKNAIVNLQLRNAQENSKVWVAIAKDGLDGEEDLEVIKQGDQTIILFNGESVAGKLAVASPSGQASGELYLIDQRIQRNLEDKTMLSDLKRGFLQSGEESAASVKIRSAGASVRPSYRQDIMSDFLKESMSYLNQLNKQFFTVEEAVRITGSLDVEWTENPTREDIQADCDVEIDVISMLPENPERELQELQTVLSLMIQGIADPMIANQLAVEGKKIQIAPIIENMLMRLKIRNPDIFRSIRPEESEGFVSVKELKDARANVQAMVQGSTELPVPPAPGQDHRAKIEAYASIAELGVQGQLLQMLDQLISIHEQLLEEEKQKESPRTGSLVKKPQAVQAIA